MEYLPSLILWLFLIGAAVYQFGIKKGNNRKAAQAGQDKERVKTAVAPFLSDSGAPIVYAHWEEQESYAKTIKTTYYRYAVAFQDMTLTIFPLGIDKKTHQVQVGRPAVFAPETLGKVKVTAKEKEGQVTRLEIWLGDKEGHALQQLTVDGENLNKSRWFPMNILQHEECQALQSFLTSLTQRVAAENPGIDEKIQAENNQGLGIFGAGVSIVGTVFSIFLPPLGILLALIGWAMTLWSKHKGAKGNVCLIINIICAVISASLCWLFWKIM